MSKENYPIVKKSVPTFYFIGVTTGKSFDHESFSIMDEGIGSGRRRHGRHGLQNS